jgi:ubiquinone/menaquinone biosynthesis C-methylase UbiE
MKLIDLKMKQSNKKSKRWQIKDEFSVEAKFYDKVWERYGYAVDVKFLDNLFRKHNCKSVIDIGCGSGNHAIRLSKLGYSALGVDISPTMLKIAKRKTEKQKLDFCRET